MSHSHYTKDENFMLALYEEAMKHGDFETPVDRYAAGARANLNPKAVDAITKLLVQANFVKKADEALIYLTPHGKKLVDRLHLE